MAPEYQKAAESLSPLIPFYNVDCDEQENKPLCAAEDIKGFPTVKASRKDLHRAVMTCQAQQWPAIHPKSLTARVAKVEDNLLSGKGRLGR
jgi:hypothetical protein